MHRRTYQSATDYAPTGRIFHHGPWQIPYKAAALCPDKRWRMVQITGQPDTYFSIPARAYINRRWRKGYVMYDKTPAGDNVLTFNSTH